MKPLLSVVIPAYNEEANLKKGVLEQVVSYLKKQHYDWEIVLVDDGSEDATYSLASKFARRHKEVRVLKEPHRGKAGAVISGMLKAQGEIILFTDMDQATPIDQIEKILPKFKEGYDVVIGSRRGRTGAPLLRKIMAYGFSFLRFLILRLTFRDTQCGFKAFRREAARQIFRRMQIYNKKVRAKGAAVTAGFDLEILYIARKLHLKIAEVTVKWRHKRSNKVNPIKDSWEGLRDLIRVRINAFAGKYNV